MSHYTVAVLGLGIVGSAILAKLSEEFTVIGIDQFDPQHTHGSSHGVNRIIRAAPFEGDVYAQMAARSFELFNDIEQKTGRQLVYKTGGMDCATPPFDHALKAKQVCEKYNLPYTEMSGAELNKKIGCFRLPADAHVTYQPGYGHVAAELSWQSFIDVAIENGAILATRQKIAKVDLEKRILITLADSSQITCDYVIYSMGSWLNEVLDIELDLKIGRRVLAWYELEANAPMPVPFVFRDGIHDKAWYGMPSLDGRLLKIGEHYHLDQNVDPNHVAPPNEEDVAYLDTFIRNFTHGIKPQPVRMATCKYTVTHNEDFIMDRHPHHDNAFIFSCCSGHGFKYAPVYGEIAESFVKGFKYCIDLSLFKISSHLKSK